MDFALLEALIIVDSSVAVSRPLLTYHQGILTWSQESESRN